MLAALPGARQGNALAQSFAQRVCVAGAGRAGAGTGGGRTGAARTRRGALPDVPPQSYTGPRAATIDTCVELRKTIGSTGSTAAKPAIGACEAPGSTVAAKEWLARNDMGVQAILPLPRFCVDNAFTGWWFTRTAACEVSSRVLTVVNLNTGAVIGTMNFLQVDYSYTSTSINTWAQQIELRMISGSGLIAGTLAQGTASCTGACVLRSSTFPPQPMRTNGDAEGEGFFDTTAAAPGAVGPANTRWTRWFSNPAWTPPTSNPIVVTPPQVRCDNATAGNPSIGCVFPDFRPVHIVSLSGAAPNYARHISDAQASGLRGAYPNGTPLTRLTDPALSNQNGNTARPAAFPRPAGHSCDEYPYRSTWEGAFTGGGAGRTHPWCQIPALGSGSGPIGWSSCMIPATENSSGGGSLSAFYRSDRVIEADRFFVWIVPQFR
jgi:hypothetical protein